MKAHGHPKERAFWGVGGCASLSRTQDRLYQTGLVVVFIIEGNLQTVNFPFESLLGAVVSAELREGTHVFRTWNMNETARLLKHLESKMQAASYAPVDALATSKRRKDNIVENIWIRQIACIPTFSETIARALLIHFGSMCDLRDALRSDRFPEVQINASGTVLGRARLKKLREVFA